MAIRASSIASAFSRPGKFLVILFFTAGVFVVALSSVGLVPVGVSEFGSRIIALAGSGLGDKPESTVVVGGSAPGVVIRSIGVSAPLVFPENRRLDVLNSALMRGVVHYPGSALPGEPGTVLLFGHSTGLAVVRNQNFAVFNRVPELRAGDVVRLRHNGREHWYRVRSIEVRRTDAAAIDISPTDGARRLIIATCRVFGGEDDRYIVTADFMESYPLRSHASAADTAS